jgi:hypothetical protein
LGDLLKKKIRGLKIGITSSILLALGSAPVIANPVYINFEPGSSGQGSIGSGLNCSGNCPTLSTQFSRRGNGSMKSVVNRLTSETMYRTEASHKISMDVNHGENTEEYWFGFSIYVPSPYPTLNQYTYEIFFQLHHSRPADMSKSDFPSLSPPLQLSLRPGSSTGGDIQLVLRGTDEPLAKQSKKTEYAQFRGNIAKYSTNKWVDFVVNTKFDSGSKGMTQIWVDGNLVFKYTGRNYYSGHGEAYPKFGMYNGWRTRNLNNEPVVQRTIFHDEYRAAWGKEGSYDAVAPGR